MIRYAITLSGCDDSTTFTVALSPAQVAAIDKLKVLSVEVSRVNCMPTLTYREATERDEANYVEALKEANAAGDPA